MRSEPRYAGATARKRVLLVPCAVDVQRFHPRSERSATPTVVYAGSLGMWYLLDEMLRVFRHAREILPRLRFLIQTQNEHDLIARAAERTGTAEGVEVRRLPYDEMPHLLSGCHVGIALLRRVRSKTGSSPVKIAEYLACGLL